MDEIARNLIREFCEDKNCAPLHFYGYISERTVFDSTNVDSMVLRTLELTNRFPSYCNSTVETFPGKNRSVLDIWRHIIYYYPDTTIFQVMDSLYRLVYAGKITTLFCSTIHRRVFYRSPSGRHGYPSLASPDEFRLIFEDWKKESPYVDIIASGYDWTCPECDTDNHEIETAENVTCKDCQNQFRVREIYHADP